MKPTLSIVAAALAFALAASVAFAASAQPPVKIQFGTGLKGNAVVHPATKIGKKKNVAWVANVPKISAGKVTLRLTQVGGPGPHPVIVGSWNMKLVKATTVLKGMWTAKKLKKMRLNFAKFELDYLRGKTEVALGSWTRLKCNTCSSDGGGTY